MRKQIARLFLGAAMLLMSNIMATAQTEKTPAFPGAEGFGRYTTGGRGGKVYTVTNLNDSGEGSLRWALSQAGPRTIVFNVDGTIELKSDLNIPSNTTIAGQTAPGMGICVTGYPFLIKGDNVIVRYMRIRLGSKNAEHCTDSWDGFGALDHRDLIVDHCSVSWSFDECLSFGGCINTTVQWCIIAQSLVNVGHSKGNHGYGGNWGGSGASYHHNLLAHHTSRAPRLGPRYTTQLDERMDMRNNVIYNWSGEGCYGGEAMNINIVNNYYKPGPATVSKYSGKAKLRRIAGIGLRTTEYVTNYSSYKPTEHQWGTYYVTGNVNNYNAYTKLMNDDNWQYGIHDQIDNAANDNLFTTEAETAMKLTTPITFVHTTTHTAEEAYNLVTQYSGACKGGYDALDTQFINDTKQYQATATGSGLDQGFINTENDNTAIVATYGSTLPPLTEGSKWTDTDGDGMPDTWETSHELNPNDPSDGNLKNAEGYTNLEIYMNSLVADITTQCTTGTVLGQEDVPASYYDTPSGTSGYYVVTAGDANVTANGVISSVEGITLTFDEGAWEVKGGSADGGTIDGIDFKKYATDAATDGRTIKFQTTAAGVLTIYFGGTVTTSKKINMTEGDNKLTGTTLVNQESIESGNKPTADLTAWQDGIKYTLEANKTYTFQVTGTKWRFAGFKYVTGATGIQNITTAQPKDNVIYDLQGRRVTNPTKGIYIINGNKVVIK
ncbi:MAG: pectate lyase [Prevotella sp.]|nr:pectate lyase [Prevotella sp.]